MIFPAVWEPWKSYGWWGVFFPNNFLGCWICLSPEQEVYPIPCTHRSPSQVGSLYQVPFIITEPIFVIGVACAKDGISSPVMNGSFYPLQAWPCVQGEVVTMEMEQSTQVFPSTHLCFRKGLYFC